LTLRKEQANIFRKFIFSTCSISMFIRAIPLMNGTSVLTTAELSPLLLIVPMLRPQGELFLSLVLGSNLMQKAIYLLPFQKCLLRLSKVAYLERSTKQLAYFFLAVLPIRRRISLSHKEPTYP